MSCTGNSCDWTQVPSDPNDPDSELIYACVESGNTCSFSLANFIIPEDKLFAEKVSLIQQKAESVLSSVLSDIKRPCRMGKLLQPSFIINKNSEVFLEWTKTATNVVLLKAAENSPELAPAANEITKFAMDILVGIGIVGEWIPAFLVKENVNGILLAWTWHGEDCVSDAVTADAYE